MSVVLLPFSPFLFLSMKATRFRTLQKMPELRTSAQGVETFNKRSFGAQEVVWGKGNGGAAYK